MIYEERRITLRRGGWPEFLAWQREAAFPALRAQGAQVVCLLQGMIGDTPETALRVVGFPDYAGWERAQAQGEAHASAADLVEREEVRLLRACSSRPKAEITADDRRPVYGYRRFVVAAKDLGQFVRQSEEGIWPTMEHMGARILGMWREAAAVDPVDVTLLTGYHSAAHWEETRTTGPRPEGVPEDLWRRAGEAVVARHRITKTTWVRLMREMPAR